MPLSCVGFLEIFGKFCLKCSGLSLRVLMDSSWMFLFTEKYHYSLWSQDKTLLGRVYFVVSVGHWGSCSRWWYQPIQPFSGQGVSQSLFLPGARYVYLYLLASGRKRGSWSSFCFTWIPANHPDKLFLPVLKSVTWWTETSRDPPLLTVGGPPFLYFVLWFPCRPHPAWLPFLRDSL